jgi:hypothetical protein
LAALPVLGVSGAVAEARPSDGTGAAAALREAAASGERVEVLDERAEYSTTYANPDGYTLTLEQSVVPVRVARPDGSWASPDATLERRADGAIAPRAAVAGIALSPGGGSDPLVTLSEDKRSLPRELRDLQLRVRAEQQTPEWKARYAVRSGVEGTVNEFARGHGMRRCRYRGQAKVHVQHVLTAIAVNIERLGGLSPAEEAPTPRQPTAFQNYLDQREIPRPKSWRILGS